MELAEEGDKVTSVEVNPRLLNNIAMALCIIMDPINPIPYLRVRIRGCMNQAENPISCPLESEANPRQALDEGSAATAAPMIV